MRVQNAVSSRALRILRNSRQRKFHAFTLVELVVVVTVLAILATVGFLALSGYTSDAGRSSVLSNLRTVEKGVSINAATTGKYPAPTDAVAVTYSGGVAWYQGTAGASVMAEIGMGETPKDPAGASEFDYSVTIEGTEFQVGSAYFASSASNGLKTPLAVRSAAADSSLLPTAAVSGNYNGLFVPVSSGGTNYLVAAPSIILTPLDGGTLTELTAKERSFAVDGEPGVPASWSGKVAGLEPTGISFGGTGYVSGQLWSGTGSRYPSDDLGLLILAESLTDAYGGKSGISKEAAAFLGSADGPSVLAQTLSNTFSVQIASPSVNNISAACGSANGTTSPTAPVSGLCQFGTLSGSVVTNPSSWTWTCRGINGGLSATCQTDKIVNAACGSANGVTGPTAPTSGELCQFGTLSGSVVTNPSSWTWQCSGLNGGTIASCSKTNNNLAGCRNSLPAGYVLGSCTAAGCLIAADNNCYTDANCTTVTTNTTDVGTNISDAQGTLCPSIDNYTTKMWKVGSNSCQCYWTAR